MKMDNHKQIIELIKEEEPTEAEEKFINILERHKTTLARITDVSDLTDLHHLNQAVNDMKEMLEEYAFQRKEFLAREDHEFFSKKYLKAKFFEYNLQKKFPDLNIDDYLDLLNNPPLSIINYDGEEIVFDEFWVRKNLIAINQMIFNEMDLYILNIGKEGSGKSCWSSQQMLYFYHVLSTIGLIKYDMDATKMFFADIESFLENHELQKKNDFFRIECLDEGNQLNRANFHDENQKQFKYEMRTERKNLRIVLLNMQQIGELDTSISLSRVNFIYNCTMRSDPSTGVLNKGFVDMYILPRTNEIYSEKHNKIFNRQEILNTFARKLDNKKDYYVSLPDSFVVKSFRFKGLWGFNKDEYDDHVKDKLMERRFNKTMKLTDNQAFVIKQKLFNFVDVGTFDFKIPEDKKMYDVFEKLVKKIVKYFENNREKEMSIKKRYGIDILESNRAFEAERLAKEIEERRKKEYDDPIEKYINE